MLKCVLCGEDLGGATGYIRGSISGEVIAFERGGPKATGQTNAWEGVAFCLNHFKDIPQNIAQNMDIRAMALKDSK